MTTTLQSFILPLELDKWIKELAAAKNLSVCRKCIGNKYELLKDLSNESIFIAQNVIKVYLIPPDKNNFVGEELRIRPRDSGWLDINPGQLIGRDMSILTLTTIQGENKAELAFKPSNWIQWLKKRSSLPISCGVKALNSEFGGQDVYKNICYSQKALEFYYSGGLWKQFIDGNVVFCPVD